MGIGVEIDLERVSNYIPLGWNIAPTGKPSSNVYAFRYFGPDYQLANAANVLQVWFLGTLPDGSRGGPGTVYEYYDVPPDVAESFARAESYGKAVWRLLRHQYNERPVHG